MVRLAETSDLQKTGREGFRWDKKGVRRKCREGAGEGTDLRVQLTDGGTGATAVHSELHLEALLPTKPHTPMSSAGQSKNQWLLLPWVSQASLSSTLLGSPQLRLQ